MEQERFMPPEALQDNTPFKQTPEKVAEKLDINAIIHSLKTEQTEPVDTAEATAKFEYQTPNFAITEYFNQGRDIGWFKEQKNITRK